MPPTAVDLYPPTGPSAGWNSCPPIRGQSGTDREDGLPELQRYAERVACWADTPRRTTPSVTLDVASQGNRLPRNHPNRSVPPSTCAATPGTNACLRSTP